MNTSTKWYRIYLRSVLVSNVAPRKAQPVARLKPLRYGDYLVNAEYQAGDRLGATLVGVTVTLALAALFVFATLGMQHREMQVIANFLGVQPKGSHTPERWITKTTKMTKTI